MTQNLKEEQEEQKNLKWALFLIVIILFGMNAFFPSQKQASKTTTPIENTQTSVPPSNNRAENQINGPLETSIVSEKTGESDISEVTQPIEQKIALKNEFVAGLYDVTRGGLTGLELSKYTETVDPNSPKVTLLSDKYTTKSDWVSPDTRLPTPVLSTDTAVLTEAAPLVLHGENEAIRIERTLTLDSAYLLSTTDKITNLSNQPIRVIFKSEIARQLNEKPTVSNVHQGFVAVLKDKLIEKKYDDVSDEAFQEPTKGGWYGLTDKYWQTAFIFDGKEKGTVSFEKTGENTYKTQFAGEEIVIPAGQSYTHTSRVFAGAKDIDLLTAYEKRYNIPKFDLTIDFGWFYFLTKPFLYILNWLYGLLGNMGIAILVFATLIRLALLPIAKKSYESMANMRKIQPKIKELQNRFKSDPRRMQIEMMNLYKREKANPMSGCLPMFLQIPVFYALYKVLSVTINMRQAPFFGWISDLSVPDPSSVLTAFGYLDWPVPALINIGILPVIMGLTMYVQQKMSPAPTDETQAKIIRWMPVIFTFMLGGFAAGLVIYWTWSNILSIAQQKYIMHKVGVK